MKKLIIFALHNDKKYLNQIKNADHIEKINLNYLSLNSIYQRNELAENRFFIYLWNNSNIFESYEYIGVASARWNEKYEVYSKKNVMPLEEINLAVDRFKKNHVYVAAPIKDWYNESCNMHEGMNFYIDEILERNNFNKSGLSFYSNNFICKKDMFVEFLNGGKKNLIIFLVNMV